MTSIYVRVISEHAVLKNNRQRPVGEAHASEFFKPCIIKGQTYAQHFTLLVKLNT